MAIKLDPDATHTDIKKTLASKKKKKDHCQSDRNKREGEEAQPPFHTLTSPLSRGRISGATAAGAGSNKACGRWWPLDVRADVLLRGAL